ncbi:hypothetical protein TSOC_002515 [Tetrabaena socialis]|uniref:RING-CH-type domain-containing protein n=1 Tax=Tetrabaena socialis TaxID=47790 RepID=A0A2J8AE09_9CHLO|nr:hypothetical protein TSOC_002515 [Tetrabaena socialis]|eukprot:PNH10736.1 hypothetical protein TSOC_002515 [Tetrabaena socialis]
MSEGGMLAKPCMCPRSVHASCLARWQLQQAGRNEERSCRFCNASLPDWKAQLAPAPQAAPVEPVMVVSLGGKAHRLRVRPGPEGMAQFRQQVRELFGIPPDLDFECSFKCRAPSGDTIQLDGLASYEAATHCASLLAAQRVAAATRRGAPAPHQRSGPASGGGAAEAAVAGGVPHSEVHVAPAHLHRPQHQPQQPQAGDQLAYQQWQAQQQRYPHISSEPMQHGGQHQQQQQRYPPIHSHGLHQFCLPQHRVQLQADQQLQVYG